MWSYSVQCGACIYDNGRLHFPHIRGRIREHVMKLECELANNFYLACWHQVHAE